MKEVFSSPLAEYLRSFLEFKRGLGYRYERAGFTLRALDRHLTSPNRSKGRLDEILLTWLARRSNRKPFSVSLELAVIRQFYAFLRRRYPNRFTRDPQWPDLPTTSQFEPWVLSKAQVRLLVRSTKQLSRPPFRRDLYRALLLILYCTGVRFGEAVRLCLNDLDMRRCRFYIVESKGRSRWVPFHRSLKREFERYLIARRRFAPGVSEKRLFLSAGRRALSLNSASETIRGLLRDAGLKPPSGRSGPRPYDFRHTFAVHRLTRWYRSGVDLQSHLPLLSAYMGHNDILGTETYLTATPELLSLAAQRLHRRLRGARRPS